MARLVGLWSGRLVWLFLGMVVVWRERSRGGVGLLGGLLGLRVVLVG